MDTPAKTRNAKLCGALAAAIAVIASGFSAVAAPSTSSGGQLEPALSAASDRPGDHYECSAGTDHYYIQEISPSAGVSVSGGGYEISASVTITRNGGNEAAASAGIGFSSVDAKDRVILQIAQVPSGGVWGAEAILSSRVDGHSPPKKNIARFDWGHAVQLSLRVDHDGLETVVVDKAKRVFKGPPMPGQLTAMLVCSSGSASFKDIRYAGP